MRWLLVEGSKLGSEAYGWSRSFNSIEIGELFRVLDMTVVHMDDHSVILGHDFLRLARAVLVPHEDCLLFENEIETFGVPMMVRKKFGRVLHISSMMLFKVVGSD